MKRRDDNQKCQKAPAAVFSPGSPERAPSMPTRRRQCGRLYWLCAGCAGSIEKTSLLSAANLSHGIGLHAMDALILSGFLAANATTIYTTDGDFEAYKKKGVRVIRI